MNLPSAFFDERTTLNKLKGYKSRLDDDSSGDRSSVTYAEMVEEVEKVSELLVKTQSKLKKSQGELKDYNSKTQALIEKLQEQETDIRRLKTNNVQLKEVDGTLRDEIARLNQEVADRDEGRARPGLEQRLRKAVEFLQKDLDTSRDKNTKAEERIREYAEKIATLEKKSIDLQKESEVKDTKAKSSNEIFDKCKKELREAKEGNAYLVEEVANLRDELQMAKKIVDQKDVLIRREIEGKVKEKIRLEARKAVTKQVTEKVTREVTSKMKIEREKELEIVRDQLKKIVKENSVLKSEIDGAREKAEEAMSLEENILSLRYEISRLQSVLDETNREHELYISKMEAHHRMDIHNMREDANREKWEHASEIRKQMALEQEREIDSYANRIEDLSRQTDDLLRQAERDNEAHAAHVRRRVEEEKEREIKLLQEKLQNQTAQMNQLISESDADKESFGQQLQQAFEQEKKREISKYSHRIDSMANEKQALQKRLQTYEEEFDSALHQNEMHAEELKSAQSEIKSLEDEIFKLKRKNQNLATLVGRYKHDAEETATEAQKSKQLFREALLKSEEQSFALKSKLKKYEPMITKSKELYGETLEALEASKDQLAKRLESAEQEIGQLNQQNESLKSTLEEKTKLNLNESGSKDWFNSVQTENSSLRARIAMLEGDNQKEEVGQNSTTENVEGVVRENLDIKAKMVTMNNLLQQYKEDIRVLKESSSQKVEQLQEQVQDAKNLLSQYRKQSQEVTKELQEAKQISEDALTVASEDNTAHLNLEIQTIERMLELYSSEPTLDNNEAEGARGEQSDTKTLEEEILRLKAILEESQHQDCNTDTTLSGEGDDIPAEALDEVRIELEKANLERSSMQEKIKDLNYLLEKYRNELSQISIELEQTKDSLAVEGETAQQLNRRVESLNILLQTTEQNHAEHSREMAHSHRKFDEAATALQREIDRLDIEKGDLIEELSRSHKTTQRTKDEFEAEREALTEKLETARFESQRWKDKHEALENEKYLERDGHDHASMELKHSKKLFSDALMHAEEEISTLKQQIVVLTDANAKYVAMTEELDSRNRELEETLLEFEITHGLNREETLSSLVEIDGNRKSFGHSLHEHEEGSEENTQSENQSSSREDQSFMSRERLDQVYDDEDMEESSSKILSRLNTLFGGTAKKVTWKDAAWDIDASTVTTNTSMASRTFSQRKGSGPSRKKTWISETSTHAYEHIVGESKASTGENKNGFISADQRRETRGKPIARVDDASHFEDAIRLSKVELTEASSSSDDSLTLTKRQNANSKPFSSIEASQKASDDSVESTFLASDEFQAAGNQPSWNTSGLYHQTNRIQQEEESRFVEDGTYDRALHGTSDKRENSKQTTTQRSETPVTTDTSSELDDESTINWNILEARGYQKVDPSRVFGSAGIDSKTASGAKSCSPEVEHLLPPSTQDSEEDFDNQIKNGNIQSISESTRDSIDFSYSSGDTPSEHRHDAEIREPNTFKQTRTFRNVSKPLLSEKMTSEAKSHGPKKSGFQRALEKASRQNWTKQEFTQFVRAKKPGRSDQRDQTLVTSKPKQKGHDQPFDEDIRE